VEIDLPDANAVDGLGQEQCRQRQHIIGANTLRFVMAAARTLWCIDQVTRRLNLCTCNAIGPGTDRRERPVNWTWYGPAVSPCMTLAFFPYHGLLQNQSKISKSLNMFPLSLHRARN
jgi:hypothetical protein